jgi:hypothetical protein
MSTRPLTSPATGRGRRVNDLGCPTAPNMDSSSRTNLEDWGRTDKRNPGRLSPERPKSRVLSCLMDIVAFQEKIGRIEGVEAARVVAGNGQIQEIHVLARRNKAPKQLVRDVQSLSQALFGADIDRRIVSVVQLADTDLDGGDRPALVDIAEVLDGSRAQVRVTLRWDSQDYSGTATGAAASTMRARQIAEATIEAIRQAIHGEAALAISSMDVPVLGGRQVAIAQVVVVTEATERSFIGCAYVEDEEARAVVRAVLDALNRMLPHLKTT